MRERRVPNTYIILSALIVLSAVITWLVPGGKYVQGPDGNLSFSQMASNPQTWQIFSAFYDGFVRQAGIIVFILIVGGAFWVLNATGAISYGIKKFIFTFGDHDKLILVLVTLLFSAGGAIFGMSEEAIPFVGIVVPLVVSLGYDAITGLLVVYVAANIGFSAAFLNPFTVGVAQQMAGLPLFSGLGYRLVCWMILTGLLVIFILFYASNVKRNVESRLQCGVGGADEEKNKNKVLVLFILALSMVTLVVGVTCFKWYMTEISALFLGMGVLCGFAGGFRANKIAEEFVAGAKDILGAALVVGFASGIVVILENGVVMDSILHSLENLLGASSSAGALTGMYAIQAAINFLIPSATAKAALTIPIMAPFSDLVGVSRQALVLAFQFGDGFTNMLTPTSGVLLASLAMAKISYSEWFASSWKYVLLLLGIGLILLLPTALFPINGF